MKYFLCPPALFTPRHMVSLDCDHWAFVSWCRNAWAKCQHVLITCSAWKYSAACLLPQWETTRLIVCLSEWWTWFGRSWDLHRPVQILQSYRKFMMSVLWFHLFTDCRLIHLMSLVCSWFCWNEKHFHAEHSDIQMSTWHGIRETMVRSSCV